MKAIYKPTGRAAEYAEYACNLYRGCRHGCKYCYVPSVLRMSREELHAKHTRRDGILEALERDAEALCAEGIAAEVLLCFTSDPCQHVHNTTTARAIEILNENGHAANVLTKAGERSFETINELLRYHGNKYGISLAFHSENLRREWEPGAAPIQERIDALKYAHSLGIKTWISFEPVVHPDEVLELIEELAPYAGEMKIGKLNYHPHARTIDWPLFREQATALCEWLGVSYYIKRDLKEAK